MEPLIIHDIELDIQELANGERPPVGLDYSEVINALAKRIVGDADDTISLKELMYGIGFENGEMTHGPSPSFGKMLSQCPEEGSVLVRFLDGVSEPIKRFVGGVWVDYVKGENHG